MKNTVVVNLFAGPGAGKTTCAWEIASELKKRGYVTEYVPEYAKELVWDKDFGKLDGSYNNQLAVLHEQTHRVERLNGQVDFIVCDSPIMINASYFKGTAAEKDDYEKMVYSIFSKYNNFSLFINREKHFEQAGRMQNLEESRKLDNEIKGLLHKFDIYFGSYFYKTVSVAIENVIYTYKRLNATRETIISENSDNLHVDGHSGSWYVIGTTVTKGQTYYLVESEQYGDEAAHLILDESGTLVLDEVCNGFDDLQYYLDDQQSALCEDDELEI